MSSRVPQLVDAAGRQEVEIDNGNGLGIVVTFAPRYLIFVQVMWSGRWQTVTIDPDTECDALIDALRRAQTVANGGDIAELEGGPSGG